MFDEEVTGSPRTVVRSMSEADACVRALNKAFTFGASLIVALNLSLPYEWRKYALKWNGELARYADYSRAGMITIFGKKSAFADDFMTWKHWRDFFKLQGFKVVCNPSQLPEGADFKLQPKLWRSTKPTRSLLKEEEDTLEFMRESRAAMEKMAKDIELAEQQQDPTELPLFDNGLPAQEAERQESKEPSGQGHD